MRLAIPSIPEPQNDQERDRDSNIWWQVLLTVVGATLAPLSLIGSSVAGDGDVAAAFYLTGALIIVMCLAGAPRPIDRPSLVFSLIIAIAALGFGTLQMMAMTIAAC